jgi:dipeptidyl aminopeptidase/acylaminoacyl peptidase
MRRRLLIAGGLLVTAHPVLAITLPLVERLPDRGSVQVYNVTYSSEGLAVKGKLYIPAQTPAPGVLFNHDGVKGVTPSTQERSLELAKRGFVVFAPSFRGEDGSEGEIEVAAGEVADVLAAAQFLQSRPEVRPGKLGLVGTSHGALVSLLAAGRAPELFAGLVFGYGVAEIYQWYDFLKSTKQLGNDALTLKVYGKGYDDVPENFRRRNGLQAIPTLQCPVLILQGAKDTLVPANQATLLAEALRKATKPVDLKIYPQAGHGFLIYRNKIIQQVGANSDRYRESIDAFASMVIFLRKALG